MNYSNVIAEAVEQYRHAQGLTGAEMGKILGITQPAYSTKVNGKRPWRSVDLDKLSALGIIEIKAVDRETA